MIFAIGAAGMAASSALDLLSSLTSSKSTSVKSTGGSQARSLFSADGTATTPQPVAGSAPAASGRLSPTTFNALLATQGALPSNASPSAALKDLFAQIDGNADGKITKAEFEDALGAGGTNTVAADDVFSKMDANGDGSVGLDEMTSALKGQGSQQAHRGGGGGGNSDALLQALQGATSTSTTNGDGSITTTLTYADGTKVTMSQPATATASGKASSQYNLVEQMVQRQSQALADAARQQPVSVKI